MVKRPRLEILAGPNGVGKSTLAEVFLENRIKFIYLNPDIVAKGLNATSRYGAAIDAGRVVLNEIKSSISQGIDFAFETTLSGKSWIKVLREAKESGYIVNIYFIVLDSADMAVERVRFRVEHGGHDIPEDVIRRRYNRSIELFRTQYSKLANSWLVVDNSGSSARIVAKFENGEEQILDELFYKKLFNNEK